MKCNKTVHMVTFLLLVVGGLNWLLVGIFNKDLFAMINLTGSVSMLVYILVGLSAIYEFMVHKSCCKVCSEGPANQPTSTM
jgi:uncharacterized membrane protein YuzA (DUF378 family)